MFQAVGQQRQVVTLRRQFRRQLARGGAVHLAIGVGLAEGFHGGNAAGAYQQQALRGVAVEQGGQRLLGRAIGNHRCAETLVRNAQRLACEPLHGLVLAYSCIAVFTR